MQEQLPTPLWELVVLNLYLGSITYLISIIFVLIVIRANGFRWITFLTISVLTVILSMIGSFVIWICWPTSFDLMLGPLHMPTLGAVLVICPLLLLIFRIKLRLKIW